jgi:peroxiredoxin
MLVSFTRRSRRSGLQERRLALWGSLALLTLCALPALGQPPTPDLIEALKLSAYPSGWRPPPFAASTVEGRRVTLADLHGRVVVLNFWATWCVSCLRELPALEQLHRDYAAAGLTVLGVNVQEDGRTVERHERALGLSFPLALDLDRKITRAYGVVAVPSTYAAGGCYEGPLRWRSSS